MKTLIHALRTIARGGVILLLLLVPSGSKAYPGTQTWGVTNDGWEYTARTFVPSPGGDVGGWAVACRDLPALPTRWTFTVTIPEPSAACEDSRCTETRFGVILIGGDCYEQAPSEADDSVIFDYDACHRAMGLTHYRYLNNYTPVIPNLPFPDLSPGPHDFQIDRVADALWTLFIDGQLIGAANYSGIPATLGTYEFVNVYCSGVTFRSYEPFYSAPDWVQTTSGIRGIDGLEEGLQTVSSPNPFHSSVQIEFSVSQAGPVEVLIFDSAGRLVRRILQNTGAAGIYRTSWDGTDNSGHALPSAVYHCRVQVGDKTTNESLVLLRQ